MIQEKNEKNFSKILEELNKVLDDITKNKPLVQQKEKVLEDYKQKIEEIKNEIKDAIKEEEVIVKERSISETTDNSQISTKGVASENNLQGTTQKTLEDISKPKVESISPPLLKKQEQTQSISQTPIVEQNIDVKTKQEIIQPEQVKQELPQQPQQIEECVITKNVIFVYPKVLPESKDVFFENMNSTLSRVSKNKVKVSPYLLIEYNSVEKDLLLNSVNINKIKETKNALFFLIVNESSSESEKFVSEILSLISFVKVITFKELKLKSTYLDIAIDLLLTVK